MLCSGTETPVQVITISLQELVEAIVSKDIAQRYLEFGIQAFVDTHPDMKWCVTFLRDIPFLVILLLYPRV